MGEGAARARFARRRKARRSGAGVRADRRPSCRAMRPRMPASRTPTCCNTRRRAPAACPIASLLARAMQAAREATTIDPSLGEGVGGARVSAVRRGKDAGRPGGRAARHRARAGQLAASLPARLWHLGRGAAARRRSHAGVDARLRAGADAGVHGVRGARHDRSRRAGSVDRRRCAAAASERSDAVAGGRTSLAARHDPRERRAMRAGALACFDEEIAAAASGHVYGSEFAVNAHVASGFTHLADEQ